MNNVIKYVKELIIKSDELLSKVLRLTPGGTAGTETQVVGTQTDDRVIELPDASGRVVLTDTTDTLTNKSIDADTNTITNLSVDEFAPGVITTDFLGTPTDQQLPTTKSVYDYVVATATAIYDYIDDAIADVYTYVNGAFFRKDGTVPMDNNTSIMWRNADDTDNVPALFFDINDDLYLQTSLYPENVSVELGKLDASFYRIYGDTFIARYLNNFNDDLMIDIENAQIGSASTPFTNVYSTTINTDFITSLDENNPLSISTLKEGIDIITGSSAPSNTMGSGALVIGLNSAGLEPDVLGGMFTLTTAQSSGTGESGSIDFYTGSSENANSGFIAFHTGQSSDGSSGSIIFETGLAPNGTRGKINFISDEIIASSAQIKDVANPTDLQDVATKNYVDNLVSQINQGLKPKQATRVATTANITLANLQTVDGVVLVAGDRVLVKDQSLPEENGIYIVVDGGAWTRSTDFDEVTPVDEINGAYVGVQEGTVSAGKLFVQTGTVTTVGVSPINFVFFNSAINYVAGDGIDIIVDTITTKLDGTSLTKSGTGLKLNSLALPEDLLPATGGYAQDLGSAAKSWGDGYINSVRSQQIIHTTNDISAPVSYAIAYKYTITAGSFQQITLAGGTTTCAKVTLAIKKASSSDTNLLDVFVAGKTNAAGSSLVITGAKTDIIDVDISLVDVSSNLALRFDNNEATSVVIFVTTVLYF